MPDTVVVMVVVCLCRSREEVTGIAARGEEGDSLSRGRPRHCRLVPGACRPTHEGVCVCVCVCVCE